MNLVTLAEENFDRFGEYPYLVFERETFIDK